MQWGFSIVLIFIHCMPASWLAKWYYLWCSLLWCLPTVVPPTAMPPTCGAHNRGAFNCGPPQRPSLVSYTPWESNSAVAGRFASVSFLYIFNNVLRLSAAAMRQGLQCDGAAKMESLGNHGAQPQNFERDGHRKFRSLHQISTYDIKLTVCGATPGKTEDMWIPTVSVHQMFGKIWAAGHRHRIRSLFGPEGEASLPKFWESWLQLPQGRGHPARERCTDLGKTFGLIFHCDGVEVAVCKKSETCLEK